MPNGEFVANLLPIYPAAVPLRLGALIRTLAGFAPGSVLRTAPLSSPSLTLGRLLHRRHGRLGIAIGPAKRWNNQTRLR